MSSKAFQNVGMTNADAVYVRQHCLLFLSLVRPVVLGSIAFLSFSGFLFGFWVALLSCGLSRIRESYVSRDLLTLPLLVQWS